MPDPEPKAGNAPPPSVVQALERAFLMGVDGTTEVWLARHGDCYQENDPLDPDPPLSSLGRAQAARLAKRALRLGVDAVYSSHFRRALETAAAASAAPIVDERLREVEVTFEEAGMKLSEPGPEVADRMRAAVEEAAAQNAGGRIVVVTHGLALVSYLADVMEIEVGRLRVYPPLASLSLVGMLDGRRVLGSLFDTGHLEGSSS